MNTLYDEDRNKIGETWEPGWVYQYKIEGGLTAGDMLNFVNFIIEQDPETVKELKTMWTNLRGTGQFTAESVEAYVDEQAELLDASQRLNYTRWNVLGTKLFHNPSASVYASYDAAVDSLKSFIRTRVRWFDQKLGVAETVMQISVSDAGWATLYAPFAFEVPVPACTLMAGILTLTAGILTLTCGSPTVTCGAGTLTAGTFTFTTTVCPVPAASLACANTA